jgi:hypothetical protein
MVFTMVNPPKIHPQLGFLSHITWVDEIETEWLGAVRGQAKQPTTGGTEARARGGGKWWQEVENPWRMAD